MRQAGGADGCASTNPLLLQCGKRNILTREFMRLHSGKPTQNRCFHGWWSKPNDVNHPSFVIAAQAVILLLL